MKRSNTYLSSILCVVLILSCSLTDENPYSYTIKYVETSKEKKSLNYDIEYSIKTFDSNDTIKIKSNVTLIRDHKDSVYGGSFWYTVKDSLHWFTKYYDLKFLYVIDHNTKEVTTFDLKKGQTWPISGAIDGEIINTYFLKPEKLLTLIDSTSKNVHYKNSDQILTINSGFPDDGEVTDQLKSVQFNKEENTIENIKFKARIDYQVQFNNWSFSNIQYNRITKEDLKKDYRQLTEGYIVHPYSPQTQEELEPLRAGTIAPTVTGKFFKSSTLFDIQDYKGKIIVLDFWYRSCYPCLKSIPNLIRISNDYRNQDVVVIGINPIDTEAEDSEELQDLIDYRKVNYDIVLADRNTSIPYNVRAYPTLYIIDKDGKIAYSKVGYHENEFKIIDSVIKTQL